MFLSLNLRRPEKGNMELPGMAVCFQPAVPDHPDLVYVQLIDMF